MSSAPLPASSPSSIAALPIGSAGAPAHAAEGDIPAHPNDLVYEEREFDPPEASDYRRVIAGGTPIYIAEDHDFPLIDLTIRVRTGSYLEPADKIGLASMTGSTKAVNAASAIRLFSRSRPPNIRSIDQR